MVDYLNKYGYTPDREAIGRALDIIAANLENVASDQVYKECFSMMDLTTLKTDDTPASVTKLVNKVNAFQASYPEWPLPASICVYSNFAATVKEARKADFNITVVSACFPTSQSFLEVKLKEVEMAVEQGADEVAGKQGREVHLKVILETGLLRTPENIANASFLAMEAGADFIKTSTGKVDVNATPVAAYVMCECIAKYQALTGKKIGFKPAGGISTAADALSYYSIVASFLGKDWLNKRMFPFGVSRVANSILSAVEQKTVSYF